jgi:PAS domain S-box-containing protein
MIPMSFSPEETQAHLAAIVASSDDAIISKDLAGVVRSWNAAAERMFGYTAAEIVGQPIAWIIPVDRRGEEEWVLREVLQGRRVEHFETFRQHKNGTLVEVSLTVSPIFHPDGRVIGASKIARDITERRLSDREALRLAAIVSSSDDAIISKDVNGIVQTWNGGAERMFGYTAAEAIGKSITLIIPTERLAEEDTVLSRIRAGLSVENFETIRRRKDGSDVEISLTVSPIRRPDGRVVGASKIARDITERKRLERAAEDANRLKDEFLAVLSHELRTPLNTVVGYTRMLRRSDLATDLRDKALDAMERNTNALSQLVNDLLDTSRIVTGKLRLSISSVSLPRLIADAIETVRPAAEGKNIALQVFMPPQLDTIGDPDRLRQVLWNLLSNAIKFTPAGGSVTLGATAEHGAARISVGDTGIGIAPEHVGSVFQRFWQAEPGISREYGGLGLGLALSRHLVELHGGTIEVKSEGVGKGTTFTVCLPRSGTAVSEVDRMIAT